MKKITMLLFVAALLAPQAIVAMEKCEKGDRGNDGAYNPNWDPKFHTPKKKRLTRQRIKEKKLDKELFDAVCVQDVTSVRKLTRQGANPNRMFYGTNAVQAAKGRCVEGNGKALRIFRLLTGYEYDSWN